MLGEYRKLAESAGGVLVLGSDHGFKWAEGRPETLSSVGNATAAKWHTDNGIYLHLGRRHETERRAQWQRRRRAGHVDAAGAVRDSRRRPTSPDRRCRARRHPIAPPVDYRPHYTPATVVAAAESAARSKVDQETVDKLRALGYIGAAGGGGQAIGTRTGGSFNNEGLLLKQQGRTAEAIEAFDSALTVDPNLASALWNLSDLLFAERKSLDKSDALLVRAFANGLPEGTPIPDRPRDRLSARRPRRSLGQAPHRRGNRQAGRRRSLAVSRTLPGRDRRLCRRSDRLRAGACISTRPIAAAYASLGLGQMCAGDQSRPRARASSAPWPSIRTSPSCAKCSANAIKTRQKGVRPRSGHRGVRPRSDPGGSDPLTGGSDPTPTPGGQTPGPGGQTPLRPGGSPPALRPRGVRPHSDPGGSDPAPTPGVRPRSGPGGSTPLRPRGV